MPEEVGHAFSLDTAEAMARLRQWKELKRVRRALALARAEVLNPSHFSTAMAQLQALTAQGARAEGGMKKHRTHS